MEKQLATGVSRCLYPQLKLILEFFHIDEVVLKSEEGFEITKEMEQKIKAWDSCISKDVNGAKFAYIFIPTGVGLIVKV